MAGTTYCKSGAASGAWIALVSERGAAVMTGDQLAANVATAVAIASQVATAITEAAVTSQELGLLVQGVVAAYFAGVSLTDAVPTDFSADATVIATQYAALAAAVFPQ